MSHTKKYILSQVLRDGLINAYAVEGLPIISIYCDDFYENYDYDIIAPKERKKLAKIFEELKMKRRSSRYYTYEDTDICHPKPTRTLGGNPIDEVVRELQRENRIILATPTQAILSTLLYCHQGHIQIDLEDIYRLVYVQPANLDKIQQWSVHEGYSHLFKPLRHRCTAIQRVVFARRKKHKKFDWTEKSISQIIADIPA
ncbi:hypothetical protein [Candidatus Uabimicrobium amorphum]|uniref:Uncharacterized protein n=1 Tax=Uabimicrobium amorphum TaxID=2596890 RepID=A0A5S9IQJ5_UABAM|nr:hypothetical protein [Candidatus Uabimicrobium amorphum]BBM84855.1 hypothetical protein UABAM_03216 [Candidatus Uabimicrobium amorphum]